MTPHIESKKEDIAPIVIMPGDPLRAKYIAEKYLTDIKLVNTIRNMFAYTGYYKETRITVFASGMGIPSIGIYAYELFRFYDVQKIIRIGSCGSFKDGIKLGDIILATASSSISSYDNLMLNDNYMLKYPSFRLNQVIKQTAEELKMDIIPGKIITSDVFDHYVDFTNFKRLHNDKDYYGCEMEAFGLFVVADKFDRNAACLLTVVDTHDSEEEISSSDRQTALDDMILLALESIIKDETKIKIS